MTVNIPPTLCLAFCIWQVALSVASRNSDGCAFESAKVVKAVATCGNMLTRFRFVRFVGSS